jgi:hypothetical protein
VNGPSSVNDSKGWYYPPRTIVEVRALAQDDIVEVEGTFYAPVSDQ